MAKVKKEIEDENLLNLPKPQIDDVIHKRHQNVLEQLSLNVYEPVCAETPRSLSQIKKSYLNSN